MRNNASREVFRRETAEWKEAKSMGALTFELFEHVATGRFHTLLLPSRLRLKFQRPQPSLGWLLRCYPAHNYIKSYPRIN